MGERESNNAPQIVWRKLHPPPPPLSPSYSLPRNSYLLYSTGYSLEGYTLYNPLFAVVHPLDFFPLQNPFSELSDFVLFVYNNSAILNRNDSRES